MGSIVSISPIGYWSIDKRIGKSKFDSNQEIWSIIIGSFDDYECGCETIYMHSNHYLKCKDGTWSMRILNNRAIPPLPQIELLDGDGKVVPIVYADARCVVY